MKIEELTVCFIFILIAVSLNAVPVGAVLQTADLQAVDSGIAYNTNSVNGSSLFSPVYSAIPGIATGTDRTSGAANVPTRLTLKKVRMIGFTGRLTAADGTSLVFSKRAKISLYKNGLLRRNTSACGMGYYLFKSRWPLPKGTYQTRFEGQDTLDHATSRQVSIG